MLNKWDKRYIKLAEQIGSWTSCYRHNVGCIITVDNRIIVTGYNGAPAGLRSCKELGYCYKKSFGVESGPTLCRAVHAEQNALIQAAKLGLSVNGGILYCTHFPCNICAKMIINSGIKRVVYKEDYDDKFSEELLKESNIIIEKYIE